MALSSDLTWKALLKLASQVEYVMLGPQAVVVLDPEAKARRLANKLVDLKKIIVKMMEQWNAFPDHRGHRFTLSPTIFMKNNDRQTFEQYVEGNTYDANIYAPIIMWQLDNDNPENKYALLVRSADFPLAEFVIVRAVCGGIVIADEYDIEDLFLRFLEEVVNIRFPEQSSPYYVPTDGMISDLCWVMNIAFLMKKSMLNKQERRKFINDLKFVHRHPRVHLRWKYSRNTYHIYATTPRAGQFAFGFFDEKGHMIYEKKTEKELVIEFLTAIAGLTFSGNRLAAINNEDALLKNVDRILEKPRIEEDFLDQSASPEEIVEKFNGFMGFNASQIQEREPDAPNLHQDEPEEAYQKRVKMLLNLGVLMKVLVNERSFVFRNTYFKTLWDHRQPQVKIKFVNENPKLLWKSLYVTHDSDEVPSESKFVTCEIEVNDEYEVGISKIGTYDVGQGLNIIWRPIGDYSIIWAWYIEVLQRQTTNFSSHTFWDLHPTQVLTRFYEDNPDLENMAIPISSEAQTDEQIATQLNRAYHFSSNEWADADDYMNSSS